MNKLVLIVAYVYLCYCPFTKVEESFNLQAVHDILYHRLNFSKYDHHEYPGVVPRTFLGPIIIAILSSPFVTLINVFNLPKYWSQYAVRAILGFCVFYAFNNLFKTLKKVFGANWAFWYILITLSQFHFLYYMTRTLPNIFALPLVLLAIHNWLLNKFDQFIFYSAAAILLFRSELVLFLGILLIHSFIYRKTSLIKFIKTATISGLIFLTLTVIIDSFFWRRLLWPEGAVFWFNTILNRSSDWGVSPYFWYWYSAIPRSMGLSILFLPYGLYLDKRIRHVTFPAILYVFIYSFLPHKELRFIIYVFPVFNIAVAKACSNLMNYPGGYVISRLHKIVPADLPAHVHIDNLAAQTGVSRFLQINQNWIYCKKDNITKRNYDENLKYSHLLMEVDYKQSSYMKTYKHTHNLLDTIEMFSSVSINYKFYPPFKIRMKPVIYIWEKKNFRFKKQSPV